MDPSRAAGGFSHLLGDGRTWPAAGTSHRRRAERTGRRWVGRLLLASAAILASAGATAAQQITIVDEHPRLVFRVDGTPGARTFQTVRDLYNSNGGDNPFHKEVQLWHDRGLYVTDSATDASMYIITGDLSHAESALNYMSSNWVYYDSESSERGLKWALAYDWIHDAWAQSSSPPPDLAAKLTSIEGSLANWVSAALADLDGNSLSLWHGRASTGAAVWTAALALPAGNSTYDSYRSRAFNHWQQSLKATHASGGWPEGPTYWANNRAVNFPLAYEAYQSAVTAAPALTVSDPLGDLRTLGLWQAYTERGDGSFERYGDVSSAVFISNGTFGRSLDYYARITQDPALAAFAEHARAYRHPMLYDDWYGWMYAVGYDPNLPKPAGYDPAHPEACLSSALPHAMLFGKDALGMAVMRQGWNPGDTSISFKAGDYMAHHGHCDQGTFTIFKYAPLVINSGGYGDMAGDHRLNYYVRTVAVNSILVQRPDEIWTPSGGAPPGGYTNDGGQRIIKATGSSITSYEAWLAEKTSGRNYECADITAFANVDDRYSYVASDLTRAYNSTLYDSEGQGGKVSSVTRQVVYLQDADAMVVFDRVASTDPTYKKKWLLHTPNKFIGGDEVVARGSATNGIIEVNGASIVGNTMTMTNSGGRLFLQVLSPRSYRVNKVGGADYRFYVEDDGNDADGYDGTNHSGGYTERTCNDFGDWRIEVSPTAANLFDTFLTVLVPRASTVETVDQAALLLDSPLATVMQLGNEVVGFGTHGLISSNLSYRLDGGGTFDHLIVDLAPAQMYWVFDGTGLRSVRTNDAGVLAFTETAAGPHDIAFTSSAGPATLLWTGSTDNRWDAGQVANWSWSSAAWPYRDGDHVIFNDTGAHMQPVAITGTVSPASVIVTNNTADITFSGTGSIAGGCGLTKNGGGTLTLATSNTYTGDTRVNAGTLILAAAHALGASTVRLGDTTGSSNASLLIAGEFAVDRDITVQDDGSPSSSRTLGGINTAGTAVLSGDITLQKPLTLTAAPGGTVRLAGALDNSAGKAITKTGEGRVTFDTIQTHGSGALLDIHAGTVDLNTDAGSAAVHNLALTVANDASTVNFGSSQHLKSLTLTDGTACLTAGGAKVLTTKALTVDKTTAKLDLMDNGLVVDYAGTTSPVDAIRDYLAAGCGPNAKWATGLGITSAQARADHAADPLVPTALGYRDDTAGQKVTVKYTWQGDTNLDGVVDITDDYFSFLDGFNGAAPVSWSSGDLNYDGVIDIANDYFAFLDGFNLQSGTLGGLEADPPTIPEPATLSLVALGSALLLRRRSRR